MNKNQKYTLSIGIEDNAELNQAIDAMIRARVQNIARQEAERLLEQEVIGKARSIVLDRAQNLPEETIRFWLRTTLRNDPNFRIMFSDTVREFAIDHHDDFMSRVDTAVTRVALEKLSGILPTDIIKTVVEAMTTKKVSD